MLLASDKSTAIIGLGVTGFSCARYLMAQGKPFVGFDDNTDSDLAAKFNDEFPAMPLVQASLAAQNFTVFDQLVLSPGVPIATESIQVAKAAGVELIGDIGLFMHAVNKPVLAITGSNGKSTVVTWLAEALTHAGLRVGLAGNIGVSPLDLLADITQYDVYVLELSSFQLEIIDRLDAHTACLLNVSADHLDRYSNMMAYHAAKQRIYRGTQYSVINRDDPLSQPLLASKMTVLSFGLTTPDLNQYGVKSIAGQRFICRGSDALMQVDDVALKGKHQLANALAVLALAETLAVDQAPIIETLKHFKGLPHRCTHVAQVNGVDYIDDSKATNTGATIAAVQGLAQGKNIILLAGGLAKGADLSELKTLSPQLKTLVVFGESAETLQGVFDGHDVIKVADMHSAVTTASSKAIAGDTVLLSPACASFDMFKNYSDRGEQFSQQVLSLEVANDC